MNLKETLSSNCKLPKLHATQTKTSEDYSEISGWLRRKPIHGFRKWEWRYAILRESKLRYFESETAITPSGTFNFTQLTTIMSSFKSKCFYLEFHSCPHRFLFKAPTPEERRIWMFVINNNILRLDSSKIMKTIASKKNFWKYERISNDFFKSVASTGDLILFQAKGLGAKIQRGLSGSNFDHIAMVLCFSSGAISLFESTELNGVKLLDWDYFLQQSWFSLYSKIVYRRLNTERAQGFVEKLSTFVGDNVGKNFGFTMKKIVKGSNEGSFFCSELIASAYRDAGILSQTCCCSSVWPVHFEGDHGLPLINADFGPLLEIDKDL